MKNKIMKFFQDEDGLTIVEYAVAAGLITLLVVGAFTALGAQVAVIINLIVGYIGGTPSV